MLHKNRFGYIIKASCKEGGETVRELEPRQIAERSLIKKYRKKLWNPFVAAVKRYELLSPGDKVAVCISGGKDSVVLAKLMQELQKHSEFPFELVFLVMDPGYNDVNRRRIEENAALLGIPITVFETDVFTVADKTEQNPCYLCARMRRGHLYAKAKELGCNKIALGHHRDDVIETTVMALFYGSQLQAMPPKLRSKNFEGMELIRPLYCCREEDIIAWQRYNGLKFIRCACKLTERTDGDEYESASKRKEIKALIRSLRKTNPNIENSIFSAIHSVCLDTFVGWKRKGKEYSFLDEYEEE